MSPRRHRFLQQLLHRIELAPTLGSLTLDADMI
jgi:hypothetical protein